ANLAWAAEKLTALLADLAGHLNAIGADCGRYDDGRAVVSKADAGIPFEGALIDLVVSAPGVLDVVRRPAADIS
ncbi:hypothetical protein, partial [Mycobacterium intracellulare]|uniref:hypothetical protein n=1 Tax=Mycobacterium intracellulare TaxID=1767 RepID=UPI00197C85E5